MLPSAIAEAGAVSIISIAVVLWDGKGEGCEVVLLRHSDDGGARLDGACVGRAWAGNLQVRRWW